MANQNKNFVDQIVDAQKKAVETVVENTQKIANGNAFVNDSLQKGSDWYKNWLDNQKSFLNQTTEKATTATNNVQDNTSKMNEFYQNWFNTQMNTAKQMWEMNLNHMKSATTNTATDPMSQMTNMWNNWTNNMGNMNTWMNNMNQGANWMNNMNQFQNMFSADGMKKSYDNWTGIFNQYYEMLNSNVAEWSKNMQDGTTQDAYKNMVNVGEAFTRFSEMWAPLWKSIQEKTFNMDAYKQYMNPAMYKDMMDKYFGFMPEGSRQYMQQMNDMMQNGYGQMSQGAMNQYQQMRGMMGNMMPAPAEVFGNMLSSFNAWQNMLNNAAAPLTKMMTPNQYTKTMSEWSDIANRLVVYNIKNAELQYMIYNQGTKVMDAVAENIAAKIQKGEEVNNMMAVYQEWLNISDKTFVSLFETEEYTKLMSEVNAMQLTLRKDIEGQMEKFMVGIPVATRSEMDELYKTIYDLKKQVRQMEKMLEIDGNEEAEEKTTRTKKKA
jgi:hypothetical protein